MTLHVLSDTAFCQHKGKYEDQLPLKHLSIRCVIYCTRKSSKMRLLPLQPLIIIIIHKACISEN